MLLKVALIVAVEFHINVEFVKLLEPPEDQEKGGKRCPVHSSLSCCLILCHGCNLFKGEACNVGNILREKKNGNVK